MCWEELSGDFWFTVNMHVRKSDRFNKLKCLPVDGWLSRFLKQLVGLWEMLASKKASVSRQGRRVHSLQDMMAFLESKYTQFKHMIKIIIVHQIDRFVLREQLWRTLLIVAPFFWAYEPHSMKTRPSRLLLSQCTTESVNVSQPLSLCEFAWWARTVNTALSSNTPDEWSHSMAGLFMPKKKYLFCCANTQRVFAKIPCCAQPVRSPCLGCSKPSMSDASSLYMFSKLKKDKGQRHTSWTDLTLENSGVEPQLVSYLGGGGTGLFTLKHNPWAWLGPW